MFKKLLLITLITGFSIAVKAQVPALNDTVQVAGSAQISTPQWRWGTFSRGGVNYRVPYLGNTAINKIDFIPTSKYLRAFYLPLTGGTINGNITLPDTYHYQTIDVNGRATYLAGPTLSLTDGQTILTGGNGGSSLYHQYDFTITDGTHTFKFPGNGTSETSIIRNDGLKAVFNVTGDLSGIPTLSKLTNGLTLISPDSVGLGGNLTRFTQIDLNGNPLYFQNFTSGGTFMESTIGNTDNGYSAQINQTSQGFNQANIDIQAAAGGAGTVNSIHISTDSIIVRDDVNHKGLSYYSHYSSNNPNWLTSKGYVDSLSLSGNNILNQTSATQSGSFRIDGVGIYGDPSDSHVIVTPYSIASINGIYSGTLTAGYLSFEDGSAGWDIIHNTGNNATIRGNTTFDNGTVKSNITPTTGTEVLRLKDTTLIAANLNTSLIRNGSSLQASANFNISEIGQTQTAFVAGDYLTPGTAFSSHSPNGYSVVNTSGIVSLLKAGEISMLNNVGDTNPWKITKLSYGAKIQTTTEFIDTLKSDIDPINPTDVVNFRALGSAISGISGDYIQNQISVFQSANMLISGIGGFKGGLIAGNPFGTTYGSIQNSPDSSAIKFQLNAPGNLLAIATLQDSTVIGSTKPIAITSGAHLTLNYTPTNSYDATNKHYVDNAVAAAGSGVYELLSNKINTTPDNSNTHYPTTHALKIADDNVKLWVDTNYIQKALVGYGLKLESTGALHIDTVGVAVVSKPNLASQMALKLSKSDTTAMLSNVVHKALSEIITGVKTFGSNILFSSTNTYNIGSTAIAAANVFSRTLVSDLALQLNTLNNNSIQFAVNSVEKARFASTTGNLLLSTTTDDGANKLQVSGGVSSGLHTITLNSLGTTTSDALLLQNTTAAANNAQQYSPAIHFTGNGWGTTTSTSQSTDWKIYNTPIQGTVPSSNLSFDFANSGGAYQSKLTVSSAGNLSTLGTYSSFRGGSVDAFAAINTTSSTAGTTVNQSPRFRFSGTSWNTTSSASNTQDAIIELRPTTGATTGALFAMAFQNNGAGYGDRFTIDNTGKGVFTGDLVGFGRAAVNATNTTTSTFFIGNSAFTTGAVFSTAGFGIQQAATTYTSTATAGTPAIMGVNSFARPVLSSTNTQTIGIGATWYIDNAPNVAGSTTITNPYALYINAGNSYLGGATIFANSIFQTAANAYTAGGYSILVKNATTGRFETLTNSRLRSYTVSTLPAGTQGDIAYVTDAVSPTCLGTLTGGGAVVTPVFYNGTAWVAQ